MPNVDRPAFTRVRALAPAIRAAAAVAAIGALAACAGRAVDRSAGAGSPAIASADALVRAMHDRYATTWYRTLGFEQQAIRTNPDGSTTTEVWLEAADLPGKLWIDTWPRGAGNGVIYRNDSLYVMRNGEVARAAKQRNALLILGFDVYRQPPERTSAILAEEGFALDRFHRTTWQGRPAYVVGAAAGDSTSRQFWVDAERLLFVRLIEPSGQSPVRRSDIRFNKYQRAGGGWVAPEVDFYVDGKRTLLEIYADIRVDEPLDPRRFDPAQWRALK